MDWENVCLKLLCYIPTNRQIMVHKVQLSWFDRTFQELPKVANVVIQQHARAFILRMIGRFLMLDKLGSRQYCWGSTILAYLYQGLCRATLITRQIEIGGYFLLIQSWAYNRILILAPRLYDNTLQLFPTSKVWSTTTKPIRAPEPRETSQDGLTWQK
ncbi:hypothetical protein Lal_00026156 [Lupinus albus]|nr:hypothetical protein Lal_00026156 [Lupinus albus]